MAECVWMLKISIETEKNRAHVKTNSHTHTALKDSEHWHHGMSVESAKMRTYTAALPMKQKIRIYAIWRLQKAQRRQRLHGIAKGEKKFNSADSLYIHKTNRIQHDWFSDIVEARWEHETNRDEHEWSEIESERERERKTKWLIFFYVWIAAKPNNSQNGRRFEFVCLLMGGIPLKHWHWTIINVPEVYHSTNTHSPKCDI